MDSSIIRVIILCCFFMLLCIFYIWMYIKYNKRRFHGNKLEGNGIIDYYSISGEKFSITKDLDRSKYNIVMFENKKYTIYCFDNIYGSIAEFKIYKANLLVKYNNYHIVINNNFNLRLISKTEDADIVTMMLLFPTNTYKMRKDETLT